MKIYHNNRCSKSRQALQILRDKNLEPEVVEYLKNPLSEKELKHLLKCLGLSAFEVIRKGESIYKENFKGKDFSNAEWFNVLFENQKLLERPIFLNGKKAIIGRPPEDVLEIL